MLVACGEPIICPQTDAPSDELINEYQLEPGIAPAPEEVMAKLREHYGDARRFTDGAAELRADRKKRTASLLEKYLQARG